MVVVVVVEEVVVVVVVVVVAVVVVVVVVWSWWLVSCKLESCHLSSNQDQHLPARSMRLSLE